MVHLFNHPKGQETELNQLISLVKSVPNGGSNHHAEAFVKAVIEKIKDLEIWAESGTTFYVLLNGIRANRYIAQGWSNMSDVVVGGASKERTPGFSDFIHSFIFALAGGKRQLEKWGLEQWGWMPWNAGGTPSKRPYSGKARAIEASRSNTVTMQSAPSSQRPTGSPQVPFSGPSTSAYPHGRWNTPVPALSPAPVSPTRTDPLPPSTPTPSAPNPPMNVASLDSESELESGNEIPAGGGLSRAQVARRQMQPAPSFLLVRGRKTEATSSLPSKAQPTIPPPQQPLNATPPVSRATRNAVSSRPSKHNSESVVPPLCYPTTLIPPSVYQHCCRSDSPLPVVSSRTPGFPAHKLKYSTDFTSQTDLFLLSKTNLPAFVEFALRAIGWGEDVLSVVETALARETVDDFILDLGGAGVPMAEVFLIWQLLKLKATVGPETTVCG
ncbi:hypothetical protein FA13DRAFT_1786356 [Coprinellus micaceus]|uniref:Uncharacterized protein n=1 Tax=Coprinellus micaceus TaxID=71717 RepID=A0A4Y7TSL4_COPMI|nr:hypothetical protein FA13DRAFT_1786356 [Coprinellus micaceus]